MALPSKYLKQQMSVLEPHLISSSIILNVLLILIRWVINNPRYNPSGYTSYIFPELLFILMPLSGLKNIIFLWDIKNLILTLPSFN